MSVSKGQAVKPFDTSTKTPKGQLFCVNVKCFREVGCTVVEFSESKAHELLGHSNYDSTTKTAKPLDRKLTGST